MVFDQEEVAAIRPPPQSLGRLHHQTFSLIQW